MTNTATARVKAYAAARSTKLLVASLVAIRPQVDAARAKAVETKDFSECQALNLSRSWIIEALEARYPAAEKAVEAAFEADEDADYEAVLLANIPEADKR